MSDTIIASVTKNEIIQNNASPVIVVTRSEGDTIIAQGGRGTQGPAGTNTGVENTYQAGEAIGGQRIVVTNSSGQVITGDSSNLAHLGLFTGITKTAIGALGNVDVISYGELVEGSFSFTPEGKIYFGTAGLITQTPPITGFVQALGHAVTATKIFINPQVPYELI